MYEFLEYTAADVMTYRPFTIRSEATLGEANRIFERHEFNCLPVTREGSLLGVLTKLDVLRAFAFTPSTMIPPYGAIMQEPVHTVMTRDPVTVTPDAALTRVLQTMIETRYKSLPVVIGALVIGVVAREDVLRGLRMAAEGVHPRAHRRGAEERV